MRLDIRDLDRRRVTSLEIQPGHLPAVIRSAADNGAQIHLDWDGAFDDAGSLRRCPVCGCPDLFARRDIPPVTLFAVVVLAVIMAMVLVGMQQVLSAVVVFLVLLSVDILAYFFAARHLVCYRCRSEFRRLPVRSDHPGWDRALADRYELEFRQRSSDSATRSSA